MTTEEEHLLDDDRQICMHYLGPHVTSSNSNRFKELVRLSIESGIIDITGWTVEAVRTLLTVVRERDLTLTLKNGSKYTTPVKIHEEPMFEELVRLVMSTSDPL